MSVLSILSVVCGGALLVFTVVDIFVTVFVIGGGAGPQSERVADLSWRAALKLHDPESERSHSLLRCAGPVILLLALVLWVAELTIAWALIFVPDAFQEPGGITMVDRLVYAGKTVVGRGGNEPVLGALDGFWESLHSMAGVTGVTFVSIGLAYVLPVLGAVTHKRSIAATVNTFGHSVDDMQDMLDRTEGGQFEQHLMALTGAVALTAERHRAYPVLHYFHSATPHASLAPAVAKIVLLIEDGIPVADKVDDTVLRPLNRSLHDLLGALSNLGLEGFATRNPRFGADDPDAIGIEPLKQSTSGPPPSEWMKAYVAFDGWSWDVVQPANDAAAAEARQ